MKPKFELDGDDDARASARLIDPDAFDASEQQFAASLEQPFVPAATNFVLDDNEENEELPASAQGPESLVPELQIADSTVAPETNGDASPQEADSWRNEVAARVNKYRARRSPREPRYPSLQLKFEPYEPSPNNRTMAAEPTASANSNRQAFSLDSVAPAEEMPSFEPQEYVAPPPAPPETTARILKFPRSLTFVPPQPLDELAEPVFDRPRILEVPETEPPPPALGGILIEPLEQPATERRPGFEVPLQSAPMSRRIAAVAIDAVIVAVALSIFSGIFFRITATVPPFQRAAGTIAALVGIFWVAYQYLLLVYTGTTPGLKLAKLRLDQFDGSAVPRKVRRWRVLASALSGLSLGLGYTWCFLDEDELCWHDRITRTYMAPIK
jgi:RDD family